MDIPANPGPGVLHQIYRQLYERACGSANSWNLQKSPDSGEVGSGSGPATISYNLAMTTQAMAICPRRSETAVLPDNAGDGSTSINGTILAGTLMVKEMSEWEAFQLNDIMIDNILKEIGIPSGPTLNNPPSTRL